MIRGRARPSEARGASVGALWRGPRLALLDRYILRMTARPTFASLGVTLTALLLERALHLLDVLSPTDAGVERVFQLTTALVPHFLGLALPFAFFIALFAVVVRLDEGAELDAMLASGIPLTRIAAPLLGLSLLLTVFSLGVFGYAQPYSRYAYRAVFHAAINAGWNGRLTGGAFVSEGDQVLTADSSSLDGAELRRLFIRRSAGAAEEIITARTAELSRDASQRSVTLTLHDGLDVRDAADGTLSTLRFRTFVMRTDLAAARTLMRGRGGDQRELTFGELLHAARQRGGVIARGPLLAELYARLARALILPLLPLLALPLGLAAKRGRRAAGLVLAGAVLGAFQYALQLGQGLATVGRAPPEIGVGLPFAALAAFSLWLFAGSRRRPRETPVGLLVQAIGDGLARLRPRRRAALPSRRPRRRR